MFKSFERAVLEKNKIIMQRKMNFSNSQKMQKCKCVHHFCIYFALCKKNANFKTMFWKTIFWFQNTNKMKIIYKTNTTLVFVLHFCCIVVACFFNFSFLTFLLHNARQMQKYNPRPESASPRRSLQNTLKISSFGAVLAT